MAQWRLSRQKKQTEDNCILIYQVVILRPCKEVVWYDPSTSSSSCYTSPSVIVPCILLSSSEHSVDRNVCSVN
jgi:hypothetical protein